MKKSISAIVLAAFLATGCTPTEEPAESSSVASSAVTQSSEEESSAVSESKTETVGTIEEFYPITENTRYVYEGDGIEYASFTRFSQYTDENRVQWVEDNGGTKVVTVVERKDGQLVETFRQSETYYRENLLEKTNDEGGTILLKEPLVVGTAWENPNGSSAEITAVNQQVETPAGTFDAIEVSIEQDGTVTKDYYAKEVGFVKRESGEVSSILAEKVADAKEEVMIRMFFPDEMAMGIDAKDIPVSFATNEVTRDKVTELLRQVPDIEFGRIIPASATLNSLYLNEDGRAYADFSSELVTDLNAGSSGESLIITSIVNTIGTYYGVEEVVLTIDGEPYVSGHYTLSEGEGLQVNLEDVNP